MSLVVLEVSALLPRPAAERLEPAFVLRPLVAFLVEPPPLLFEELPELEPLLGADEPLAALLRDDAEERLLNALLPLLRDA